MYGLGPYLFGVAHALHNGWVQPGDWWLLVVYGLFFTFPANLLVYGLNDIYDRPTDALNPKKQSYERVLDKDIIPKLVRAILISVTPFLLLGIIFISWQALVVLILGCMALALYSVPPARIKAIPVLDSFWNGVMSLIGFVFIIVLYQGSFPWYGMGAGFIWASALHAYSAVPDITYDTQAGIETIATRLGAKNTLWLVMASMKFATVLGVLAGGWIVGVLGAPYIILTMKTYFDGEHIMKYYKAIPWITTGIGMILFFLILL